MTEYAAHRRAVFFYMSFSCKVNGSFYQNHFLEIGKNQSGLGCSPSWNTNKNQLTYANISVWVVFQIFNEHKLEIFGTISSHSPSFSNISLLFCCPLSINLSERADIIHLPSRLFPQGKLLQRAAWPRSVSGWPASCLPFCVRRCLFNKVQSERALQRRSFDSNFDTRAE